MKHLVSAAAILAAVLSFQCGRPQSTSPVTQTQFRDAAAATGLLFRHDPSVSGQFHLPEIMGSGAALLDYDNDGDLDVFLVQGSPSAGGNRLFRNDLSATQTLRFTDVTTSAGLNKTMYGMGVATGDFDNDGFIDLYVTAYGENALYRNQGDGTFRDLTASAAVGDQRWSTSATFADIDRDGLLDLLVLNYVDFTPANNKKCASPSGRHDYCTPKAYHPVPARLFHNEGQGRFRDISTESGISAAFGPGLGVCAADFNADGAIDFFVANDTAANLLWINRGNGVFTERGLEMGAAYSEDGVAKAGMGVSAGDYDGDGDDDLIVLNLAREGATLLRNDGRAGFEDLSLATGLRAATLPLTGFGTAWFDYDNDGRLDLFAANGGVTIIEELAAVAEPWPFRQRNALLRNSGDRFLDVTANGGPAFAAPTEVSRGAAFGDIDNDGDIDLLVTNNHGPVRLWLNQQQQIEARHWVSFRLEGRGHSSRMALGARVSLHRQGLPTLHRRVHTDSSYLSAMDSHVHFGLGSTAVIDTVAVLWPDGSHEQWKSPAAGRVTVLRQGEGISLK